MRRRIALFVFLVFVILSAAPARSHLRAALVLRRFAESAGGSPAASIDESRQEQPGGGLARLYRPRDQPEPPGLVLVHGIHRLGVDEPRLVRFARSLAESGVAVLTPEVRELADYRLDLASVETIGASAHALRMKLGRKVGVMGMSFAGGLALLAATDHRFEPDIGLVVSVGAHHDAARVCRFFATHRIERADGGTTSLAAHEYGALVFVYAHVEHFFPAEDAARARQSLALWLSEQRDQARAHAADLTAASRLLIETLFEHRREQFASRLLEVVDGDRSALRSVSPHHRLSDLRLPVFLLHGAGDSVIPATETEWLAKGVPAGVLRDVLISPAVVHVEIGGQATLFDQWWLVHFLANVLTELHAVASPEAPIGKPR